MPGRKWTTEEIEYITVKLETSKNYAGIARAVQADFPNINRTFDAIRHKAESLDKNKSTANVRRLFFDIETSYMTARVWRTGRQYIGPDQLKDSTKIICISYKWQGEDKVHSLKWTRKQDDSKLIERFIKVLGQADEIVAHNGDRFDIKQLRTRAIQENLLMFPTYRTFDTLKKLRKYLALPSNKLDYVGKFFGVGRKMDHDGFPLWIDVVEGNSQKRLDEMVKYCERDVILLEDVFYVLAPYVDHNTNFSVLSGGPKWGCPHCASLKVKMHRTDTTAMGYIRRFMKCECNKQYKVSNLTYISFLTTQRNVWN